MLVGNWMRRIFNDHDVDNPFGCFENIRRKRQTAAYVLMQLIALVVVWKSCAKIMRCMKCHFNSISNHNGISYDQVYCFRITRLPICKMLEYIDFRAQRLCCVLSAWFCFYLFSSCPALTLRCSGICVFVAPILFLAHPYYIHIHTHM